MLEMEQAVADEVEQQGQDEEFEVVRPTRQSARVAAGVRRPPRYNFHTSVRRGLREHGEAAYEAIVKEFKQLFKDKKALIPVKKADLSQTQLKKILRSSMFLKEKYDAKGEFEKMKARLVADGRKQDRAMYPDNNSPTVAMRSLLMCLLIGAKEGRKAMKIDIGGAYLNAEMTGEEVLMELDVTLADIVCKFLPDLLPYSDNGKLIVRLDKALYGCVQSAKLWYQKLTNTLKGIGFVPNAVDHCVMNKTIDGRQLTVAIYVDDILALSVCEDDLNWLNEELKKEFDEIKSETSDDFSYLGMHITLKEKEVCISMKAFVEEVLHQYGDAKMRVTPATAQLFEETDARLLDENEKKLFHTTVAKLLYLGKRARPDILLAVLYLCRAFIRGRGEIGQSDWVS